MTIKPINLILIIAGSMIVTLFTVTAVNRSFEKSHDVERLEIPKALKDRKTVPVEPRMDWVCICSMKNGGLTFHFTDTSQNKSLFTTAPTMTPTVGLPECPLYRCFKDAQRLKQATGLET